ncbi:MAG: hypothetical protein ACRERS_09850 [Methylococcales bacterium]
MIEYTLNREIGPAKIACGPDVNNCCEKTSPCAVRRIAPPHLFRRSNTQFELRYNKPQIKEFLAP